ncbi:carboxypeptidase B1-like [Drosophila takahashii]|uniref:carboxypeptidase B1-like n=1 Tax=Drosophila takahashii TaxID=29030 RepID=UPI001CF8A1E4|nr:mast cell carboxypeptidase A-like [Drosophila takahashii]
MWRPVLLLFAVTASADYFNSQTPILKLDGFYTYDEMSWYLQTLSNSFKNVELQKLTKTYEFRYVYMVKITAPQDYDCVGPKKVILLDAAIQGNEWMTTSVALKIIHELVLNYEENKMLLERFDWYILPMVNPDGYEYSQHPLSHFWKKNRSPNKFSSGTNLNRNFNSNWHKLSQENISPFSQQFPGNISFSERESNIIASLMKRLYEQNQHFLYITLQTKSRPSILYPSPLETMPPTEIKIFKMIAEYASANIFEDTRPLYLHIPPNEYQRLGGSSLDYAYLQGFPLTFALEVFEAKEFKGNPRIFIDERVFVGWSGVFNLVIYKVLNSKHPIQ